MCGKPYELDERDSFCCSDPCDARLLKVALDQYQEEVEREKKGPSDEQ